MNWVCPCWSRCKKIARVALYKDRMILWYNEFVLHNSFVSLSVILVDLIIVYTSLLNKWYGTFNCLWSCAHFVSLVGYISIKWEFFPHKVAFSLNIQWQKIFLSCFTFLFLWMVIFRLMLPWFFNFLTLIFNEFYRRNCWIFYNLWQLIAWFFD